MYFTELTNCQKSVQHTLKKTSRVGRGENQISQKKTAGLGPRPGDKKKDTEEV